MLPEAFAERMQHLLGEEYEAFAQSYLRPRNTALRLNTLKPLPPALPFEDGAVPWEPAGRYYTRGRPGLHPWHDAGVYYMQEPSAMAPVGLLDVEPGQRVLDLCAAPGGKTTQIAAALQGRGLLVCNEIHPKRARILSGNIERMGVSNALVLNEHPQKLESRFPGYFHRILVDAPCSGEGMFRKEEDAVTDWSPETVAMCAARQQEILSSAARMLAPGGRLVYSTCTFSPEENEGTVSAFLKTHPDFTVRAPQAPWFSPGRPDWISQPAPGVEHTLRLWPHRLRGEGHFAAVLERAGSPEEAAELPQEPLAPLPREIRAFLEEEGLSLPAGGCLTFGETVYLAPPDTPSLRGLRVLRAGLELGQCRKGRFLPAHALALWLPDFPRKADFSPDSPQILSYLRGMTLEGSLRGWVLITCGGYGLGWAKGDGQILKNHFPKGLRRV